MELTVRVSGAGVSSGHFVETSTKRRLITDKAGEREWLLLERKQHVYSTRGQTNQIYFKFIKKKNKKCFVHYCRHSRWMSMHQLSTIVDTRALRVKCSTNDIGWVFSKFENVATNQGKL